MIRLTVAIAMMFAINNSAFAAHYEGDAGPNAWYEMDTETGIMRIYGNGELYNYHGSWTYYSSYSQLDHTGNGVTGTQNGAQYTGNSPLNTNFGTNRNPIYLRDYLTTVIIEEGITSVGAAFFYNCQNLTSISMPSSLTLINYEAFRSCKTLEQIEIGPNVEHVMGRWATECDKFNYISVNPANTHFISIGGVLYSADTTILVCFPEALNTIEYVIPEGTVYAATDALYHLRLVQSITIPTTMVDIEYGSFDQCPNLKTLVLKASTPPTLHKSVEGTTLTGIFVPCGEAATYSNNGNWGSYGGGHIQNAVVVEFYVETNNIELGDVEITSRADCEGYEMTITAVPTSFGTFSHWQDGNTSNPRTIAIDKEDLSIIYRYKAFFDPKPYRITLNKTTEQLGSWFNQLNVKDYYQVSATKGSTTIATTGTTMTVTSPENTFFYGDTVTLYCDITGSGVKFSKWGDGSTDDPRVIVVKETGSYTGQLTYSAEIKSGSISIKTASNNNNYGTTSPTSQTATFGDEVTFSATPKPKYQLSYWDDEPGNRTPELTRTVIATGDKTYTAFFAKLTYKITAVANDEEMGTCSGFGTFEVDATTTIIATPNTGYKFVEWQDGNKNASRTVTVTMDQDFIAYFEPIPYTIRFLNYDGEVLQTEEVNFNTLPEYKGSTPTKPSTDQYDFTFDKWSPTITKVSGATDYTATYTNAVRSYQITFKNDDGTELEKKTVNFGVLPSYTGSTPTKPATAQYSYTHLGWTPEIATVTGNAVYTATYNSTVNQYTVRFLNGENVLQTGKLDYGATPSYTGATPTKAATDQYTYTFSNWSPAITTVTGNQDYAAQFSQTTNKYTILFKNDNGQTLQSSEVEYGTLPVYTGATPTKDATAEYTYTFKDWGEDIVTVTGAKTYTATYTAAKNKYTVTFKNYDGTPLQSSQFEYGATPVYNGAEPTRPDDAQYEYHFSGWSPDISTVTDDVIYTAQYVTDAVNYTITFNNWDGSLITTKKFVYNAMPSYTGADPTRPATAQYTYTFKGWTPAFVAVTENKTYTAEYNATVNTYSITFVDDDNTPLKTLENVPYGETPSYGGTPTKAATAQYSYTFAGWTPTIASVTGNATYKATYNSTVRTYTITFIDGDGIATSEVLEYGEMPNEPANPTKTATTEYTYTFKGWDKPVVSVSGDATYTAQFNSQKNKYTIQFVNWNGAVLQSSAVEYGLLPSYTGIEPTKDSDAQYNYSWTNGWDKAIETVKGDATYTATFNHSLRSYTITFVNENGSELWKSAFDYGETPVYGGNTPTKLQTDEYTYSHSGWTPELAEVTADATYTATFIGTKRSYTVRFENHDGTLLHEGTYTYGYHPSYTGATPQKENTAQYTYTFSGWNPAITNETVVTGNVTYTAQFSSTENTYLIQFKLNADDETPLYQSSFKYGVIPEFNGVEPEKPSDGVNNYTFIGWDPTPTAVTGTATYIAKFSSAAVLYDITFVDYDGSVINTEKYEYGQTPSQPAPTRQQNEQYTYTFAGWSPAIATVTEDASYTATYNSTVRSYTITFIDGDGNATSDELEYGVMPTAPAQPTKTETAEYSYTFKGWDKPIVSVSGPATYTAEFTAVKRKYTITFADYDGSETSILVQYGETPSIDNPTRPADVQYTYTFTGWTPTIAPVTKDERYTANYSSTLNKYTITVLSSDEVMGVVAGTGSYNYNQEISIRATAQTGYHFIKWHDGDETNPRAITVVGNAEYTAMFAPNTNTAYTLNIYTQNIEDDSYQMETQSMYGTTNQLTNYEAPNHTGFELQDYEQVTINANGNSVLSVYYNRKSYNLSWNANGGNALTGTYTNGMVKYQAPITAPNTPERIGFEFGGWQPNLTTMPAEDIVCIAQWTEKGDTPYAIEHWLQNLDGENYTLNFTDSKTGKTNTQTSVAAITYTGFTAEPEKTVNCNIEADGSGVAKIYYKRNIHTLSWIVDGNEITENCTYGNVMFGAPIAVPADPEKDGYTFDSWNSNVETTMPDNDVTYTAQWSANTNTPYTVMHYKQNIDGSYNAIADETESLTGTTATLTAAVAKEYIGFTCQAFDQTTIAADGSTVISINYERNHYALSWDFGDCTVGNEPYTNSDDNIAFGTPIVVPTLIKDGYTLTWNTEIPATMPNHDLSLTATWTANDIEYTVNHWLRTVDGSLYTLDATETLAGPTDAMTEAVAKPYTGFTAQAFNQVTIAADGSTVINIEYSRNWHNLTWNIGEGVINTETVYTLAADSVPYGQPIIAPVLIREGFSYSWDIDIPETMPDNDLVATAVWTDTTATIVSYVVRHNQQALDGSFAIAATDTLSGIADSLSAAAAKTFEGFTAQEFEQATIAADGSTIIEIQYLRNSHQLTWAIGDGNIDTTVEYTAAADTVLFGTPITAPVLVREGFTYIWNAEIPAIMPDSNFTATAVWTADNVTEPKQATYLVRHNQQALDSGFVIAAVDTLIGFADSLTVAVAKTFEGFTAEEFEQDSIAADSSTVVNINYSRNKYTLTWNLEGETPINDNYTKAGQVAFGTPIVAPQFMEKDYTSYSWDTLPETMPADNLTCTLFVDKLYIYRPDIIKFNVPNTFVTCDDRHIEVTDILYPSYTQFTWSVNGVVDESQTGASFDIPEDAAPTGTITVTGEAGGDSMTKRIQYTVKRRIITTMWDDVITVDNTTGNYESYNWYHNGELVSDKAYYQEIGGLTGNYYLTAVTIDGVEINSCEEIFEEPQTTAITAYPNPTTDKVIVKSGKMNAGDRLIVTDSNGKIWKTETVSNPAGEEFDLSNLPQGSYTISAGGESINIIKL